MKERGGCHLVAFLLQIQASSLNTFIEIPEVNS